MVHAARRRAIDWVADVTTRHSAATDRRTEPPEYSGYPVLVVEDHELFSTSLVVALRSRGVNAGQIGTVSAGAILAAANLRPGGLVVLDLDVDLGRNAGGRWLNGLDLLTALRDVGWQVLVMSKSCDQPRIAEAIAAGAIGAVPKSAPFDALLKTVLASAAGEAVTSAYERQMWITLHRIFQAQQQERGLRLGRLSAREREVLERLAAGHRAASIAAEFVVSLTTVRSQIRSVLSKLGVNSQLEAVAMIRDRPTW